MCYSVILQTLWYSISSFFSSSLGTYISDDLSFKYHLCFDYNNSHTHTHTHTHTQACFSFSPLLMSILQAYGKLRLRLCYLSPTWWCTQDYCVVLWLWHFFTCLLYCFGFYFSFILMVHTQSVLYDLRTVPNLELYSYNNYPTTS
jgi:hypothetical protein